MHQEHSPPTVVTLHSGSGTIHALAVLDTDPRNNKQQGLSSLTGKESKPSGLEEAVLDGCFCVTMRGQSLDVNLRYHQLVRHIICVLDGRSL